MAVVLALVSAAGVLVSVPRVGAQPAEGLFDGLVEVPGVGTEGGVVSPSELASLPSRELVEPAPVVPEGDFSEPPLLPGAPEGMVEAFELAEEPSFDPARSERIEELTNARREVFVNEDGSHTVVVSAQAERYRDESGEWADIDLGVEESASGELAVEESPVPVTFSESEPGAFSVETAVGDFEVSAPDVAAGVGAEIEVEGSGVVASTVDEVETHVDVTVWGVEHSVVVPDAASPSAYELEVALPSGVAARQGEGRVEFVDGGGRMVSSFGGGLAFDSAETGWGGEETSVQVRLVGAGEGRARVSVGVDEEWFGDPERVFPVTIDPSFVGTTNGVGAGDTWIREGLTSSNWGSSDLRVGTANGGANFARSLIRFPLPTLYSNAQVDSASVSLHVAESQSCSPTGIVLNGLSSGFDETTVWSTAPSNLSGGPVTSAETNKGGGSGCGPGRVSIDATEMVRRWRPDSANAVDNFGLRVRAANELVNSNRKIFSSGEQANGEAPYLAITYNNPPLPPVLTAPTDEATVLSATPTLSAEPVVDPDGQDVEYWFSMWTRDSAQWGGQTMSSGWVAEPSWSVPVGTLSDGGRYRWAVFVSDGVTVNLSEVRVFDVDLRLGAGGPSAQQSVGPVSVNLATGNLTTGVGGPQFPTVAGSMGASLSYNSQAPTRMGLSGRYWADFNQNGEFDDGPAIIDRTDPFVGMGWGEHSPGGGVPADQFLVRWRGTITVPESGAWYFGGVHDNGMRVTVDGEQVFNKWNSTNYTPDYGNGTVNLAAGVAVPITVEYRETTGDALVGLWAKRAGTQYPVPGSWLRPHNPPANVLPQGWTLSTPLVGAGPVEAITETDIVRFRTADGGLCCAFLRQVNTDTWAPAEGQSGRLLENKSNGRLTYHAPGGTVYVFAADGTLESARTAADSDNPAALVASYGVIDDQPRLTALADPIAPNGRVIDFDYSGGGNCPTRPDETFDAWSTMDGRARLCRISYWDGRHTNVFYRNGNLTRVVNPGNETTDFGYSDKHLVRVRSPLVTDAVAAGVIADLGLYDTRVAYGDGRVAAVTLPQPDPANTTEDGLRTEFAYQGLDATVSVLGAPQPNGYSRSVSHDVEGRLVTDTGLDGLSTTTTWDDEDRVVSVVDGAGLRATTVYDDYGRATDSYGPAPQAWFGPGPEPLPAHAAATPHSQAAYDEGIWGLAAVWWDNVNMAGAPAINRHGIGTADGSVNRDWGASMPAGLSSPDHFSGRLTGWIHIPDAGDWDFRLVRDGKVRLFVDDELVIDSWTASTDDANGPAQTLEAGRYPITIEYAETTGDASLQLRWRKDQGDWGVVSGVRLTPGYGNATTVHTAAGQEFVYTYDSPHLGETTTTSVGGLTASNTYEGASGDSFRRVTGAVNAAGNESVIRYYGGPTWGKTRSNPCDSNSPEVNQGNQPHRFVSPDPDGSGPAEVMKEEYVYDAAGRPVAERVVGDADWTCTVYDDRGRPTEVSFPAHGNQPARTITYDYAVIEPGATSANPLLSEVSDTIGTILTAVDLLGRTIATTDVWDNTTVVDYDDLGRVASSTGVGGTLSYHYDTSAGPNPFGLLRRVALDDATLAVIGYDPVLSRVTGIDYPDGSGNAGNGTRLERIDYDAFGRTTGVEWRTAAGQLLTSHQRSFDDHGRVVDEGFDGTLDGQLAFDDANPTGDNYSYDAGLGRLVSAHVGDQHITYGFAATGGCGISEDAGLNTNITSITRDSQTTTFCYDHADRLTSTTAAGIDTDIDYDHRGNTTTLGDLDLDYDLADRHIATTDTKGTTDPADDTTTTYDRDATGAIITRQATGETTLRYTTGPAGMAITTDVAGSILERIIALPGGVTARITGGQTWSYPNLAGAVAATANGNGDKTGGTFTYDPYGNPLDGLPDNRQGSNDNAWLGAATEHAADIDLVQMGERVYSPLLGRFLQTDPKRGASANDYDYAAGDPINYSDPTGTEPRPNHECIFGCRPAASVVNPVGAGIRLGTYVGVYATTGDPKLAGQAAYGGSAEERTAALRLARKIQTMKWDILRQYVNGIVKKGGAINKYLAGATYALPRGPDSEPAHASTGGLPPDCWCSEREHPYNPVDSPTRRWINQRLDHCVDGVGAVTVWSWRKGRPVPPHPKVLLGGCISGMVWGLLR